MDFKEYFKKEKDFSVSAPGRVEIGGNHTDHQGGCVFAGAINLRCRADVSKRADKTVRIYSEGHGEYTADLSRLEYLKAQEGTTTALIKGVAKRFEERGRDKLCGFDAYVVSDVPVGSGLSSSAAFEVLIGRIFNKLGNFGASALDIAQYARYAENVYYGKPCGLMDQLACSAEGLSFIDFKDSDTPKIEGINIDLKHFTHVLCTVSTGGSHEVLTSEYAAIPAEMREIATLFGAEVLSQVDETEFYEKLPTLRRQASDRAVLRAMHFFEETKRAHREFDALRNNNFEEFLKLIRESGKSSFEYLQNVIPAGSKDCQDMAFTLCLCERLLEGEGAVRVHGGGFAGSVLAFVPCGRFETFKNGIEKVLGSGSVRTLEF